MGRIGGVAGRFTPFLNSCFLEHRLRRRLGWYENTGLACVCSTYHWCLRRCMTGLCYKHTATVGYGNGGIMYETLGNLDTLVDLEG